MLEREVDEEDLEELIVGVNEDVEGIQVSMVELVLIKKFEKLEHLINDLYSRRAYRGYLYFVQGLGTVAHQVEEGFAFEGFIEDEKIRVVLIDATKRKQVLVFY